MRSSTRLQRRFGLRRVYILGCSVYALGFVLWGSVSDPTILSMLTMLEGVAFSLLFTTGVVIVGRLLPSNLYSTGNAVTGMVGFGIGPIIGAGIGGFVYERMGPGILYGAAATLAVAAAVVAWFALNVPVLDQPQAGPETDGEVPIAPLPDTGPTV
jgi:MFS family permease